MSKVNPVVLMQLIQAYHFDEGGKERRSFVFQRNNLVRIHRETEEEVLKRKSLLDRHTREIAETSLKEALRISLQGKIGKVYIHPEMKRIAVPLEMATGESGFGVLPTGSRVPIPEGEFIRAFTYWEQVNDIDLSVIGVTDDWKQTEFSWRTMYGYQGPEITFSGDQTSGYDGGCEYFDIHPASFRMMHPEIRYLILCDNMYSASTFDDCICKAGFMTRKTKKTDPWKGTRDSVASPEFRLFDPQTVKTSFTVNSDSTFVHLFAIDLKEMEMIWLNVSRQGTHHVAGDTSMKWLKRYLQITDVFNVYDLYSQAGTVVNRAEDADVIVADLEIPVSEEKEKTVARIHSWDVEQMLSLLSQ